LAEELAIDLPKFMESTAKEKATILLQIIGVGPQLIELDNQEATLYNDRRMVGQIADQKAKYAKEQPYYPEAPKELVSVTELIEQQQAILARNGENQRKRENLTLIKNQYDQEEAELVRLRQQLAEYESRHQQTAQNLEIAQKSALDLQDESTEELQKNIADIDEINRKVRANSDKEKAEMDAAEYKEKYEELTVKINNVREQRTALLDQAPLPLPGLSVQEGELIYNGQKWDNMSGSDQLKVSTAIVRKLKPECGFVLLDKLEQMDMATLQEFGAWLEQEGLQAIATRVSVGDECEIIIEDGYAVKNETLSKPVTPPVNDWSTKGAF
ncbi:chromosome segregation protein SMC, partial [Lactobacillus murinus]|uniref:chromosome segregation protein SMC n=1 Tax=Ligilactobacillus murinus TaxID=1622 RepID=UPI0013D1E2CD